jgi:hypothetical protein
MMTINAILYILLKTIYANNNNHKITVSFANDKNIVEKMIII